MKTTIPAAAIRGLGEIVCRLHALDCADYTSTPMRKDLEELIAEVERVRGKLDDVSTTCLLIGTHDKERIGLDGWPVPIESDETRCSYGKTLTALFDIQETTRHVIETLPHPKSKKALPMAASGILHLYVEYGCDRPAIHADSRAVKLLEEVCVAAKMKPYSRDHLKAVMRKALNEFDPHYLAPELKKLVGCFNLPLGANEITY